MFLQRQTYFSRLIKSYPILKLVDVYDRQSFIRAYVLDNVYICVLMHILFYVALWYATTVIKKMEKSNKEMLKIMEQNRTKLDDIGALKDKKTEYDKVVVKVKETQKLTSNELEDEMRRLSSELINAADKLSELEKIVEKYKSSGKSCESSAGDVADRENEHPGTTLTGSLENLKILEPSFPPPLPPEPPPRKYGIFVTRPPGQRRPTPAVAAASTPPKIGFK
ncbi:uncharacterized protein LOC100864414 isoform X2 [Apis florea]|uniref:uncharacterized protein LOC100864414 isoform X2 n=1 Tax=Apis florea TaxID=7463 RepID=UPI000252AB93|nr:uncharacterized protein LOC100864414 isoform X2 [Apis florea]XP_031771491.1 uncharacterized protein LOC100864414 isoform X2 [Apis florea]